jgi:hypothetical protein
MSNHTTNPPGRQPSIAASVEAAALTCHGHALGSIKPLRSYRAHLIPVGLADDQVEAFASAGKLTTIRLKAACCTDAQAKAHAATDLRVHSIERVEPTRAIQRGHASQVLLVYLGTVAVALALSCSFLLDGQPSELQAEQAVAQDAAEAPLQARRLAQIDEAIERATGEPHPSTRRPLRRKHPSAGTHVATMHNIGAQEVAQ